MQIVKRLYTFRDLFIVFIWREFTIKYRHSVIGIVWAIIQPLSMNTRLGFSIAVHSEAEVLLLDEILSVGDESFREKCLWKVREIKNRKTVVLVPHNRKQMEEIADRIIFLKRREIMEERKEATIFVSVDEICHS